MSIFSTLKDETAPAIASIEEDAVKAIDAGRQWIADMLARLNDFKTALEKDIEDAEAGIKQAAADAESLIAGKKDALAKVNAELQTYSGLAPATASSTAEPVTTAAAEPAQPAGAAEPAAEAATTEPAVAAEPAVAEPATAQPASAEGTAAAPAA